MIDTSFLGQLKRFQVIVNKRLTSSFIGGRKSVFTGNGLTFNDFRPYVPGDDFRAIDWNIYARTDSFFIKRYEEDRNLTTHVLLDVSKSMDYGTGNTKFEYASMIALGFAYLASRNNEKCVLSLMNDKTEILRSQRGSNQVMGFLDRLNKVKCKGKIDFNAQLRKYKKFIKSKSQIVLISDFLYDLTDIKETLYLYKQHDLKVIQILDQSETQFKVYGSLILEDSETGETRETFINEKKRQDYREKLYSHISGIEKESMQHKGKFFLFSTEQPVFDAFYRIMQ